MSRLLITGAHGLIGSALVREAVAAGHHVTAIDDHRAHVVEATEAHTTGLVSIEQVAVTGLPVDHPDIVIHCAAPVGPVGILGRPVLTEMTASTQAAITVARQAHAALVVFSSSEVYGTTHPTDALVVPDDWSHRTEYAVGKIVTEQLARRHHAETGLPTMVVRPWNVVGPHQAAGKGFAIPRMAEQAAAGRRPTVYRPGDQRRAFMHVDDLARGLISRLDDRTGIAWMARPIDAAAPRNATSMIALGHLFADRIEIVDPLHEHGPAFREAHAGSKLPPPRPEIEGRTPLTQIVAEALDAARARLGVAA